jgi:DNA adenine methylase
MVQNSVAIRLNKKPHDNVFQLEDDLDPPKPFLKWVGGKRSLLPQLDLLLPDDIGAYLEPFIGGGAMFFHLIKGGLINKALLADINEDLVKTWVSVRDNPHRLLDLLRRHKKNHCEEYYYHVRDHFKPRSDSSIAARLIYLNKTCFNGLYRLNSRNKFNVPMGKYSSPRIVDVENIQSCQTALRKTEIQCASFSDLDLKDTDFAYLDPPYDDTFTNYKAGGFHQSDQCELRDHALAWAKNGVRVMMSNSDTQNIRNLYSDPIWNVTEAKAPRMINSNPNGRGAVTELVIRSYD